MVGQLFGNFHRRAEKANLIRPDFVMADATRRGWIHSIRKFVLDGARYARPRLGPDHYLIIKEPNGSVGAPLLMGALPESRMVLRIRDPRDVVSSTLDGARRETGSASARTRADGSAIRCRTKPRRVHQALGERLHATRGNAKRPTMPTEVRKSWSATKTSGQRL